MGGKDGRMRRIGRAIFNWLDYHLSRLFTR